MDYLKQNPFKVMTPEEIYKAKEEINKKEINKEEINKEEVEGEYSQDDKTQSEDGEGEELYQTSPSEIHSVPQDNSEAFLAMPDDDYNEPKYFRRADWGAQRPKWIESLVTPITRVAVSYTHTKPCMTEDECKVFIKKLQQQHLAEDKVSDIKYNFLIGGDGNIYEGRGYTRVGPVYPPSPKHIEDLNGVSIDIGLIEMSGMEPSQDMRNGLSWCMARGVEEGFIDRDFTTYYHSLGEIDYVQPPSFNRIDKKIKQI